MSLEAAVDNLKMEMGIVEDAMKAQDERILCKADRDLSMAIHSMGNVSPNCNARRNLRIMSAIYQRAHREDRDKLLCVINTTILTHKTDASALTTAIITQLDPIVVGKELSLHIETNTVEKYEQRRLPHNESHGPKDGLANADDSYVSVDATWVKVVHFDKVTSIWKHIGEDEEDLPDEVIHYRADQATPLDKNQGAFAPAYVWKDISQLRSGISPITNEEVGQVRHQELHLEDACKLVFFQ